MRTVILDMQSGLYAGAVRRALVQELTGYQIVISPKPEETAAQCRLLNPYALLLEVTAYAPWRLPERLELRESVKRDAPECRIVLMVDEVADRSLAGEVKKAKQKGLADAFLYTSATEGYLAAVLDSL
ncbi:MAG: hypothetical protein IJ705_01225 [Oscillospiraceae bacterium]|nr:hypothetical protein [Oscillospiraceae bacterium]